MEVIFIDDASTDETPVLQHFRPRYPFRYNRNETNLGLSKTRNLGLSMAQGEIIILLDAEMIVEPDYVKKHYKHHLANKQAVVFGRNKHKFYPYLFPGLNSTQINEICQMAEERVAVKKRIQKRLQQKNLKNTDLRALLKDLKEPVPLLSEKEILDMSCVQVFSLLEQYSHNLLNQLEGRFEKSRLTWLACFGSNLSFQKTVVDKIGGYDENFKGWGLEDTEFAYRLYKSGAKFVVDSTMNRYHQEHPITADRRLEEKRNLILFQQKHPVIEVCLKSLNSLKIYDFRYMDEVLQEHSLLCERHPGMFGNFKQAILCMLQQIPVLITENQAVSNLLFHSGLEETKKKQRIINERDTLDAYGRYGNLVRLFDLLIAQ
jgi:glycosyltransferase involved in cell wall biosynthesis